MSKVNYNPRISANQLGSYIYSLPAKRQMILKRQKFPEEFIVARYRDAVSLIARILREGHSCLQEIYDHLNVEQSYAVTPWQKQNVILTKEAIQLFVENVFPNLQKLPNFRVVRRLSGQRKLVIGGTEVSIHPDLEIAYGNGNTERRGYLKFCLSKTSSLGAEEAKITAVLLQMYAEETDEIPAHQRHRKAFLVVDVFSGQVYEVPLAVKQCKKHINAACMEISQQWPAVSSKKAV